MFHGLSAGNQDAGVSGLDKRALSPELVNEILKGAGHTFHYHVLRRRQMTSTPNLQATRSQLSALNFVRLSVSKGLGGTRYEIPPLQEVLSQENAEAAVSVCNGWDNDHLMDFEDFFRVPLFLLTLHIRTTKFCRPSDEEFKALLAELNSLTTPAGLVIVLKSDAIACVKPRFSTRGVLVTFHANLNKYPYSVRLSADTSLESVARQLGTHSPAAAVTVSDEGLKQQAEFLDNFTAYVLVPRKVDINSATLTESLIKSSLTILSLRTEVENLRSRKLTLARDTKSLEAKLEETAKRYDYYERQNRTIENRNHSLISAMGVSSSSPGSPHDRHHLSKYKSQSLVPDSFSSLSSSSFPSPSSTFTSHRLTSGNGVLSEFGIEFDDNLEYAMALQREFDEENLILAAERDRVVRDVEETMMMCNMCYKARSEDSIIRMDPCGHAFCPDCLRNHVVWELNGRHFPVLCPACRLNPTNEQEANVVTDKMVLELGITDNEYDIWVELQMSSISVILHCPKCENFVFVDRQDVEERTVLLCPISSCDNIWCKLCQTAITVGGRRPQQQQQQQQQRRPWDYQTGPVDSFSKIEERRERLRREQEEHAQWHHRQQSSARGDLQRVIEVQGTRVGGGGGGFTITVPNFLGALVRTIHVPIENAISSVIRLGDSILKLSENYRHNNHQRTIITTMIGTTRALALRSQREFRSIHERTMEALELTSEINVEITYWITLTEIYLRGLQESYHLLHLLAISHDHSHSFSSFSSQETTNIQLSEERIYIALQDCENVKKEFQSHSQSSFTQQDHQRRIRLRATITIRNLFGFALGIQAPFNTIEELSSSVENLIRTSSLSNSYSSFSSFSSSSQQQRRQQQQQAIEDTLTRFESLIIPGLKMIQISLNEYRTRLTEGINLSFDLTVLFGHLVSRQRTSSSSSSFNSHSTSSTPSPSTPTLIKAVVKLQRLLDPINNKNRLTGAFLTSPETVLNDTLRRLADSDVPPADEFSALMSMR